MRGSVNADKLLPSLKCTHTHRRTQAGRGNEPSQPKIFQIHDKCIRFQQIGGWGGVAERPCYT